MGTEGERAGRLGVRETEDGDNSVCCRDISIKELLPHYLAALTPLPVWGFLIWSTMYLAQ